jgi:predicted DNA-binding transcriptional regulator AlpA
MDLNDIIHSENAGNIQLVVTAKDLRELLDGAMAFAMKRIKEADEPSYYSRDELAAMLHVSQPTLLEYRKKGWIPEPVKMDGRVLYDKAKVRDALANNKKFRIIKQSML